MFKIALTSSSQISCLKDIIMPWLIYFCYMTHMLRLKCLQSILLLQNTSLMVKFIFRIYPVSFPRYMLSIPLIIFWDFNLDCLQLFQIGHQLLFSYDESTTWKIFEFESKHSVNLDFSFFISIKILFSTPTCKSLNKRRKLIHTALFQQ